MLKKYCVFLLCMFGVFTCMAMEDLDLLTPHEANQHRPWKGRCKKRTDGMKNVFCTLAEEVVGLYYNMISWDTLKVIASVLPVFIGARMIDEQLQNCFYDWDNHRNRNCPPKWCHDVAEWSIAVPITAFGLQLLFGSDEEFRQTNLTMLVGMPFVVFGKDIIKDMRFDACLRPWNGDFGCEERSSGGFPSGHAAEATYMALYYGLHYGPKFGVPLGIMAVGLGATFLTCNRHYLSQLIAGAGLGAIFALAAHKYLDHKLSKQCSFNVSSTADGMPSFKLSYAF